MAAKRPRPRKDSSELGLFLDMLTAERGVAAHTLEAYTRDLADFLAVLAAKGKTARTAAPDHIRAYLAALARKGLAPTSRARKLSAIRQFFRFLLGEGLRGDDPCAVIDSPRLGRPLPKILSLAEVETLLGDPAKAKEKLGWVPEITTQEMCAEMVAEDLKTAKRHALLKEHGMDVPVSIEN